MFFADIELHITEDARKKIEADVELLVRHPKYFQIKLDRVNLYMPLVERILKEEEVPDDFKYLVIQESALISDAVSTSNAVGFWQFKKDTGMEVGLRIDDIVDERMNIISSTRGAARYLKRHNFYFDNWMFTLLSYYLGRGGASNVVDKKLYGAKSLTIDKNTNWYIIKFLAHKIAFQDQLGTNDFAQLKLIEYNKGANKSLRNIAQELAAEEEMVRDYNKWLKKGNIPDDRLYTVIVPVVSEEYKSTLSVVNKEEKESKPEVLTAATKDQKDLSLTGKKDAISVKVNNISAVVAKEGDNAVILALNGGITKEKFLKYNDLTAVSDVLPGQIYYTKPKKNKSKLYFHTVAEGETLWEISQKYGIKQKSILSKNRIKSLEEIKPGRILWLHKSRPAKTEPEYVPMPGDSPLVKEVKKGKEPVKEIKKNPVSEDFKKIEEEKVKTELEEEVDEEIIKINTDPDYNEGDAEEGEEEEDEPNLPVNNLVKDEKKELIVADPHVKFVETSVKVDTHVKGKHVVQKGETLYSISRVYGLSVSELLEYNDLNINDGIKIGQELALGKPGEVNKTETEIKVAESKIESGKPDDRFIYHTVVAGENLYKIAREYQVSIKEVMDWNNKKDFSVGVGEVLKIKKN
jgi:membrane-bound lytic murein transglycosylase D